MSPRIGIYGGTFDPIHTGHLILGRDAVESLRLDRLLFVPALRSPHKDGQTSASGEARLEMIRAAIAGEPQFEADAQELSRPPPSFAVDTVASVRARFPNAEIFFLVGQDNLPKLDTWHRFEELDAMVTFVVLSRPGCGPLPKDRPGVERRLDISATEIRKRIASGLSVTYLVPGAVNEIIRRDQLYRIR